MKTWLTALVVLAVPALAGAHPLGNFTTNRYAALTVEPHAVRVAYVVDLAELPAYREIALVDTDGSGSIEPAERDAYTARQAAELARDLELTRDAVALPLSPIASTLELAPGAGGLRTLRLDITYRAELPRPDGEIVFRDHNFSGRPGWREVIATAADGVQLEDSTVPAADTSRALRAYPETMLQAPLQVSEARFTLASGTGSTSSAALPSRARSGAERFGDRFTALITDPAPLGPWTILTSLLVAAVLGGLHAFTPGHGKTVVGAYLIGSRGTARHALLLGLVVTATHTLGVYLLGLGTLAASAWIVPERLYPWISVVSGLLVVAVGASLAASRLRAAAGHHHHHHHHHHDHAHDHDHGHHHAHDHGHEHFPPPGTPITLRGLIALGVSGGLLPCPSALVVMLGAIALGRVAFGLVLIVAFSVGLAAVLTGIGIVLVYARGVVERLPLDGRFARYAPVASAVVISLVGIAVVVEALAQMGV
jgi:nickel/cobalt exporter